MSHEVFFILDIHPKSPKSSLTHLRSAFDLSPPTSPLPTRACFPVQHTVSLSRMSEKIPQPEAGSKSGAKNAKTDAAKAAKKRPDPAALELITKGDAAMSAKDFASATALFQQAKAVCESSTVEVVTKERKPKQPPADAQDNAKPHKPKPHEAKQHEAATAAAADAAAEEHKPKLVLTVPRENVQAKPLREGVTAAHNYALNSPDRLNAHLASTGGCVRTRFPPEPNGYLHIGHAKAMSFNFGQARLAREGGIGGETVMRFDDTNPAAEKQEYIDSILENVTWLGHAPAKVWTTYPLTRAHLRALTFPACNAPRAYLQRPSTHTSNTPNY